jgi:hypothetical protein
VSVKSAEGRQSKKTRKAEDEEIKEKERLLI